MIALRTAAYRSVIREVYKSVGSKHHLQEADAQITGESVSPRSTRNQAIASNFRAIFASSSDSERHLQFDRDMENAVTFMRSQRMHKALLERYNPLHDMTVEERVKATARRVGLDMPVKSSDTAE